MGDKPPILILVHGTGDSTATPPELDASIPRKWWEAGSEFDTWLRARVATAQGLAIAEEGIVRFQWSGENSEKAREEGAQNLADAARRLAQEGRILHFIAHSHGGNVVRRALELGDRGNRAFAREVGSVTAIGTPFFHYSSIARVIAALTAAVMLMAVVAFALYVWRQTEAATSEDIQVLLVFGFLFMCGVAVVVALPLLDRLLGLLPFTARPGQAGENARKVNFVNFVTQRDEAIGLLSSFNSTIFLMRRAAPTFLQSPHVGCGYMVLIAGLGLGAAAAAVETVEYGSMMFDGVWGFLVTVVTFLIVFAATALAGVMFVGLSVFLVGGPIVLGWRAVMALLDIVITMKLRSLAFGNDAGNGLNRVALEPWKNRTGVSRHVPEGIEAEIEAYVSDRSTLLWAKLRAGMTPGVPLLNQDLQQLVMQALTWNELSHTVYYRVPAFVELVATRLCGTGCYRARG